MVLKVDNSEETKPILRRNEPKEPSFIHQISEPPISHPIEALDFFSTAVTLNDVRLARRCVEFLNRTLDKHNALYILRNITKRKFSAPENYLPSAPPLHVHNHEDHCKEDSIEDLVDNLRNSCLLEIDKNGEFVLKSQEVLELDYRDLLGITTRDTLVIPSELVVYHAVVKWGMEKCKRRGARCQDLRNVLGELVYAPRYGLMTKSEFLDKTPEGIKGPAKIGILRCSEVERIIEHIKAKSKNQRGPELPFKGSQSRRINNSNGKINGQMAKNRKGSCNSNNRREKLFINFLTCWTAVFD